MSPFDVDCPTACACGDRVSACPASQIGGASDDGDLGTGSATGYQQAPSSAVPTRVSLRGRGGGGDNL